MTAEYASTAQAGRKDKVKAMLGFEAWENKLFDDYNGERRMEQEDYYDQFDEIPTEPTCWTVVAINFKSSKRKAWTTHSKDRAKRLANTVYNFMRMQMTHGNWDVVTVDGEDKYAVVLD